MLSQPALCDISKELFAGCLLGGNATVLTPCCSRIDPQQIDDRSDCRGMPVSRQVSARCAKLSLKLHEKIPRYLPGLHCFGDTAEEPHFENV